MVVLEDKVLVHPAVAPQQRPAHDSEVEHDSVNYTARTQHVRDHCTHVLTVADGTGAMGWGITIFGTCAEGGGGVGIMVGM